MLGEPVLIGRASDGKVFALRDICPHRGIPLHYGKFDGETIECAYHGWRYGRDGGCVAIPSLREGQQADLSKIRTRSFPCVERQGLVWIYFARGDETPKGGEAEPPKLPVFADDVGPSLVIKMHFACSTDHAAFGLMDPTHAAYVHTSWWFKRQARTLRPKEKAFEPSELGWQMVRHDLPPQNLALQAPRQERLDRDHLPAARPPHRGDARRQACRGRPHGDHADHRRGDRGPPDVLDDAGLGQAARAARPAADADLPRPGPPSSSSASARG